MSIPSSTIRCTGCEYEIVDPHKPILLIYQLEDGVEVTGQRTPGWCYSCDSYVYIEQDLEQASADQLTRYQALGEQSELLKTVKEKQPIMIALAKRRVSKMSCLECWSKDTVALEKDMSEIEMLKSERESLAREWAKIETELEKKPLMEFATKRQKRVIEEHLYGDTESERATYLEKIKREREIAIGAKHDQFFKNITKKLKRAKAYQKFKDFNHECGGVLLRAYDTQMSQNIPVTEYVLSPEGFLIEER